jgi:hypothetical protein
MKRLSPAMVGAIAWAVVLVVVLAFFFLCGGCHPAAPTASPKPPACYLAPGSYHMIATLMAADGCPKKSIPPAFAQSLDIVPGQLKCGFVATPLASGALLLMKVKPDMVIAQLAVTDGKCHIRYAVLILPKAGKR